MVEQVVLWCDRHYHRSDQELVFGTPQRFGWETVWYEVHLCPECVASLMGWTLGETIEFFRDYGEDVTDRQTMNAKIRAAARESKAVKTAKKTTAPAPRNDEDEKLPCPYCDRSFTVRSTLERHLGQDHGLTDFWGSTCPLCGQPYDRLAQHVVRGHGMHISLAFAQAETDGDPYGVVTARRKEVLGG